jgi:dTDP-glucose 4,6-dehydratase
MLESFLAAGRKLGVPLKAMAMTRDAGRFAQCLPHLANDPRVELWECDVTRMSCPSGPVDYIIHSLVPDAGTPLVEMKDFFSLATQGLLHVALEKKSAAFLLCSTGAVYQPTIPPSPFSEESPLVATGAPLSYSVIRRQVEDVCRGALEGSSTALKIARAFTFVGPRLPLDAGFAIGNFVRDALAGGPIVVKGDGSPLRSYLYAADMSAWLWNLLLGGPMEHIVNVGSDKPLSIGDLAHMIGRMWSVPVTIQSQPVSGAAPASYVPLTARAEQELGLTAGIPLRDGIERMARWHSRS